MDSGEIGKSSGGDDRVVFTNRERHKAYHQSSCNCGGADGKRQETAPISPMKKVTLAEPARISVFDPTPGIQKAVAYIHGPSAAGDQQRDP